MADEYTRADALRIYHTGASAHEAAQTDSDLSLGKYRSSTEITPCEWDVSSPISGISVDFVAGANGPGNGTLTASGSDELKWTPPGGSQGSAVTILNGQTKVIEGGGSEPHKYLRVSRTSAAALTGTATITITDAYNNAPGYDDVSSSEQAAGDIEYRCLSIHNEGSATIQNVKATVITLGTQQVSDTTQLGASGAGTIKTSGTFSDWPEVGFALIRESDGTEREIVYYSSRTSDELTVPAAGREMLGTTAAAGAATDTVDSIPGIAIGKEAPSSQPNGTFTDKTGAGEGSAPAGVTFSTPIVEADAVDIGNLAADYEYGIWMKRQIPVGAEPGLNNVLGWTADFDSA